MDGDPWSDLIDYDPSKMAPRCEHQLRFTQKGKIETPHARRGMAFEDLTAQANVMYEVEARALIEKQEVPWRVKGYNPVTHTARRVWIERKSSVDWHGSYVSPSGAVYPIWFETKEVNDEAGLTIDEEKIPPHQLDWLIKASETFKGVAFLLVWSAHLDKAWVVDPAWVRAERRKVTRYVQKKGMDCKVPQFKSTLKWAELETHAHLIPWRQGLPDFLVAIDRLFES